MNSLMDPMREVGMANSMISPFSNSMEMEEGVDTDLEGMQVIGTSLC